MSTERSVAMGHSVEPYLDGPGWVSKEASHQVIRILGGTPPWLSMMKKPRRRGVVPSSGNLQRLVMIFLDKTLLTPRAFAPSLCIAGASNPLNGSSLPRPCHPHHSTMIRLPTHLESLVPPPRQQLPQRRPWTGTLFVPGASDSPPQRGAGPVFQELFVTAMETEGNKWVGLRHVPLSIVHFVWITYEITLVK